jgi:predicted helicase
MRRRPVWQVRSSSNPSLTLGGISPETSDYRLGNRSELECVIDQYQISEDKRSRFKGDPNREDDEEYVMRLTGQVVRVSAARTA